MLKTCSSALLLSGAPNFIQYIRDIANDIGVELTVADEWNKNYRLNEEIIICGSRYLSDISVRDYDKVRLILKTDETVSKFIELGITHFIFDYNNMRELAFSFYTDDAQKKSLSMNDITMNTDKRHFVRGKYDFNFSTDSFKYDGVGIYLRNSEKIYLAQWLLLKNKDNSKRVMLYRLRQRFGESFLSEIDRYGNVKGEDENGKI